MKKILILWTLFLGIQGSFCQSSFDGHWTGFIEYKNSSWPMKLQVNFGNRENPVLLSLPSLIYAQEPIKASQLKDTLLIELPFGLGKHSLLRVDDKLKSLNINISVLLEEDSPPPYNIQDIEWNIDHAVLKGKIYVPSQGGPFPLMIRLHGSATGTIRSWEYRSWADYFARKGIAVIIYDRRGEGQSSGHISDASFDQLANDAIALINKVKSESFIDSDKIILGGGSQACYVSFIIQEENKDVDFLMLSSCSSVEVIEQEYLALRTRMIRDGRSMDEIQEALAYQQLYFYYIRTGRNWKVLATEAKAAEEKTWGKYIDMPRTEEDLKWWRATFDQFLPEKHLTKVKIPGLYIYGEEDPITPPQVMMPMLKYYFKQSGFTDYEIYQIPDVGHNQELNIGYDQWGRLQWPEKHPEMLHLIGKWFERHGIQNN